MPYCTNCGRSLQDGETCGCTASPEPAAQPDNSAAPQNVQPYNGGMQPPPYSYNGQPYPNQPYPQGWPAPSFEQQLANPPKKSNAWVFAIVIPIIGAVLLLLTAILVPAMLGYTKRSKQASMFSKATTLYKASNTVMVELDEEGKDVKGYYIISSDKSRNSYIPFDVGEYYDKLKNYMDDVCEYEYFIVCRDGIVEYAAISENWNTATDHIGTYPGGVSIGMKKYSGDGRGETADKKTSLSDLFLYAVNKFSEGY